jgi:hypothetical protein
VPAANTLAYTTTTAGGVLGPLAAGLIFGAYSTGAGVIVAYAVDAVLFTITFWATWRLPPIPPMTLDAGAERPTAGVRGIVDGLRFLLTKPVLLLSFGVDIIAMVFAMPRALFPEVAEDRFGGGSAVGWLFAAIAIGSVIGGLTSGWIGRVRRQGLALVIAVVGWGVAVGFSGFAHALWLMVALLAGRPGQCGVPAVDPADLRAGPAAWPTARSVHRGGGRRAATGRPASRRHGRLHRGDRLLGGRRICRRRPGDGARDGVPGAAALPAAG